MHPQHASQQEQTGNVGEKTRANWQYKSSSKEIYHPDAKLGHTDRNLGHRIFHITSAHLLPALN